MKTAGRADVPVLAALAARTAADTPTSRWLVPDSQRRIAVLDAWFQLLLERALQHGCIDMLADRSAALAWIEPGPDLEPGSFLLRLSSSCGKHAIMLLGYHYLLLRHRPATSHMRLIVLAGTNPAGIAELLAYRHRQLDSAATPTSATADNPALRDLLITSGYQVAESFRPAAGPQLWSMWRPAAPPRPQARPAAGAGA
ncbi:hypothetical protein JIG36_51115 [Actinoplanes sp. LDG1-06]|uniref:Uncharacterized protein n=1 Tax=Paractinoplanes ovalisporus TaxID=2810368 RepID=A0ABS2AVI7_9ACTN|nr:hypothetical protein [Actinoplanes ovalisporus]MBM2623870.1 hypothetical protein [Actinoplanes ovalisporus]